MSDTQTWIKRIAVDPGQCGGRPCIRGMRIRVIDVLDLLASGLTQDQVLEELPDLEREDIEAVLHIICAHVEARQNVAQSKVA